MKIVEFGKMRQTCKNETHLQNGSNLVKWVTLGKMCHIWIKGDTQGGFSHTLDVGQF